MGPQRNQMRHTRGSVRSIVACGRRLGCDGERKEVSVIAIDVMKGLCDSWTERTAQYSRRESETKGREGRVESCELDQLHGRLRHTLPKCTFGSAAHSLRHYDGCGRPNHAHGGGGGTHSTETGGRDSQKRPNSLTASLTGSVCL